MAHLKALSEHCNFEAAYRTRALRDRFVCGISSDAARRKLLSEKNLTLDRASEIVRTIEQADKDLENMAGRSYTAPPVRASALRVEDGTTTPITSLTSSYKTERRACCSCGSMDHLRKDCKHLQSVCHNCGLKGHLQSVCEKKDAGPRSSQGNKRCTGGQPQNTHALDTAKYSHSQDEESAELAHIHNLTATKVPAIMLDTSING